MTALQAQAYQLAVNLFIGAIQIDPMRADFHANLGLAKHKAEISKPYQPRSSRP